MAMCPGPPQYKHRQFAQLRCFSSSNMVLDIGSYRSPWASAYPLGLGYVFALGLEQGYTFAVETIVSLLMLKLVCILILLFVVVAHIDAQKDDYHNVLLD